MVLQTALQVTALRAAARIEIMKHKSLIAISDGQGANDRDGA
jgi:hypothetical protein